MQLILEGNSNRDLVRHMGNLTMQQAMNGPYMSIGALVRSKGRQKVEKVVAVMVAETAAYFDEEMGSEKALDIATEITSRYAGIRIEDIWVCLNELKSSEIYGKLTSNKVLSALRKYVERRMDAAAQQSLNDHLARQEPRSDNGQVAAFAKFKHQFELDKMTKKHGTQGSGLVKTDGRPSQTNK